MNKPGKVALLSGVVVLLVFVALYLGHKTTTPPPFTMDITHKISNELGFRVRSNLKGAMVVIPDRPHPLPFLHDSVEYKAGITRRLATRCSTNAFGHRGGPMSARPSPGTTRVFCFGDDITFGLGVNDAENFPTRLQGLLGRHGKFEVVNAGNPGEQTGKTLQTLERFIVPLRPHVVLLCLGRGDILNQFQRGAPAQAIHYPAEYDRAGEWVERLMAEMIALLRKKKIKVALVVPPLTSFFPYPYYRRTLDAIVRVGKKYDVPVFDLEEAFRQRERKDGLVFEMKGDTQSLVKYLGGQPRRILSVKVPRERPQYISGKIYAYLDQHDAAQALSIDDALPNARGHDVIAGILSQGVLKMVGMK